MATPRRTTRRTPKKAPELQRVKDDFVYSLGDTEITMPSLTYLQTGLVRRMRGLGDRAAMWFVLEETGSEEALKAIDETYPDELDAFMSAWAEHSGITLGESEASTS
ncbi:hypothetical protein [Nocardia thailandica]